MSGAEGIFRSRGFTLVELIMVILVASILALGTMGFIRNSILGYVDTARRQELASTGMVAAEKVGRELRNALPNSIRVTGDQSCLEFIPVLAGSTYVSVPTVSAASSFQAVPTGTASAATGHIVVYPISSADLYVPADPGPSSITLATATLPSASTEVTVNLGAAHQFTTDSPAKRFYVTGNPVAYCQVGTALFRYSNYGFITSVANLKSSLPASGSNRRLLVAKLVNSGPALWQYDPGTLVRNAVVRMAFDLQDASATNETIHITHEVQIRNVP